MRLFILVIAALVSVSAQAKEYSLKDLVKRYLETSPELKSSQAAYMASHYDAKKAASKFFPNLSLSGSITEYKNPTISSLPGTSTTGKQYLGSLDLVQPLYAGGAVWRGLQIARLSKAIQEQTYLNTKQESLGGLIVAAIQYSGLREQLKVVEESQKYQERFYNLTRNKAARGAAKNYELSQARADLLSYTSRIQTLKQQIQEAESRLKVMLDLSESEPLNVVFPPVNRVEEPKLDDLLNQANQNRPSVKMSEIGVEVARQTKWLNLSDELPSLSLVGSVGYKSPTQEDFSKETTKFHSIGVSLKIPLFSGLSSFHKYQSGEESIRSAEEKLSSARRTVRQEVETALDALQSTGLLIQSSGEWAAEARKALNSSIDSYRIGVISSVQVIQVQRGWEQAEISLITAKLGYHSALANLRKAIGTDLEQVYAQ